MHHTCTAHAPHVQATVLFCENNFWGRTIAACSSSSDPSCRKGFGPFLPGDPNFDSNPITNPSSNPSSDPSSDPNSNPNPNPNPTPNQAWG